MNMDDITTDELKVIGRKYEENLLAGDIKEYLIDSGCSEANATDIARNIKSNLYDTLVNDSDFMTIYHNTIIKLVDDYLKL